MNLSQRPHPAEILLVEDSLADVRLFIEALRKCSIPHHLTVLDTGHKALSFLRREAPYVTVPHPDLVVLDLNLPGLSGREVVTTMRADPALQHFPVVILTSSSAPQDISTLYRIPVNCFITKPFDIERFFTVVRTMVEFWLGVATLPERVL